MNRPPRLLARVGAALNALTIGATLRVMAPFSPWWGDVALYALFAATGWWGVGIAERHPDETPRQQVIRGARWIAVAGLVIAGTGVGALLTSRTEYTGLLAFALFVLGGMLALVAVGGVALGCHAGRILTDAGDASDALDQLAARTALAHGLSGAALWLLGRDATRGVGLFEALATLIAVALVWRRDSVRLAEVERLRAGETARDSSRVEAPFRTAAAVPDAAGDALTERLARLHARRRGAIVAAVVTAGGLGVATLVYRTVAQHSLPEGTTQPAWVAPFASPVVHMSGANGGVCAELGDGSVWCWGNNAQRFPGHPYAGRTPIELPSLRGLHQIALSSMHGCALRGDGRVVCWGYGGDGRLGASGENASVPRVVAGVDDVARVMVGEDFSCALRRDGSLWCWGCSPLRARYHQGGCAEYQPERVEGVPPFVEVVAGAQHACGRTGDGAVWCWGVPDALPQEARVMAWGPRPPRQLALASPARAIFAGPRGGFAVDARGAAWRWGVLPGLGEETQSAPVREPQLDGAVAITQRLREGCAVTRDGAVVSWGDNVQGQRALGHKRAAEGVTRVPGLTRMRGVVAADGGACAWRDGDVACWGAMGQAR